MTTGAAAGGGAWGGVGPEREEEGGGVPEDGVLTQVVRARSMRPERDSRTPESAGICSGMPAAEVDDVEDAHVDVGPPGSIPPVGRKQRTRRRRRCARLGQGLAGTTATMTTAAADGEAEARMEATNPGFPRQFLVRG